MLHSHPLFGLSLFEKNNKWTTTKKITEFSLKQQIVKEKFKYVSQI
jgi:hypothetical protein